MVLTWAPTTMRYVEFAGVPLERTGKLEISVFVLREQDFWKFKNRVKCFVLTHISADVFNFFLVPARSNRFLFAVSFTQKFLSGMPHLCKKMKRLTSQDFVARKSGERERTPNFKAPSRRKPVRKGPVVKDYPDASFMARRAQMVRQGDLMAGPGTVPPMGMAGMGYPNGDVQDSILNSMQLGGAPNDPNRQMQNMQMQNMQMQNMQANMQMQNMQLQMQNNILMRQFLAANMGGNPLGGVAPNFGASIGMQGMGGALNFGVPNGMQGMGGTPNFGAPNGLQGMGGTPNFGVPNGMQGMGGAPTPNFGASIGMQGMGGTPNFGAPNGMQGMGGAPNYGAPNGLQGMGGTPNLGGPSGMGNWYG
jgi:hypothetical protein